ncbi:MAG: PaaI family thioesterase [Terracidiphilus sp.]
MKIRERDNMLQKTNESAPATRVAARAQSSCFACGPDNERGLRLRFQKSKTGESVAEWTPEAFTEGFRGVVHGGIVCTVLDEAMSKAVSAAGLPALTAELRVRLRHHVPPGCLVQVRGWINSQTRRLIKTEAAITNAEGIEMAHAWASFLVVRRDT